MAYDAVIVPGGGVRADGTIPAWVENRFDIAQERCGGAAILCLSSGTVHKPPPLDRTGRPVLEAEAGARYLLAHGIPAARIYTETASLDTIGNAFFARAMHTDVRRWLRLLIVNSDFHMPRTQAIFRWVFELAPQQGYTLEFEAVPNIGMEAADLAFRVARERESLESLHPVIDSIRWLEQLHEFLFTRHGAYSAAALSEPREVSPELSRVY